MTPQTEIQLIAAVTAAACGLVGAFLVLRKTALLSDAISHAILPGIVLAFFWTENLNSPLLLLAAALTGVLTVGLIEALGRTRLVKQDAAIALVFPALFSIGVVLISRYASGVHLDTDAVLLGDPAFSWIRRFEVSGRDLGPQSLWLMGTVLALVAAFVTVFYKELKISTFDAALAGALGLAPAAIHYALMTLVSVVAVGAFDVVGSILVVGLMIAPPAAAWLLTDRLPVLLGLSVGIGVVSAISGYWLARGLDVSIAGAMAVMAGVWFAVCLAFAPERGLVAQARRRARQRVAFAERMLLVHLLHHEHTPEADRECRVGHLSEHLRWERSFAARAVRAAERGGAVTRSGDRLALTAPGREAARRAMVA
ncbi:zinc ABC transporter permease [Rubrivirga sp. SAORIC476]|uniref:metal ABC transporter permease n=1 Tax=Rubrivirga sp. SAORIC476 TaxID=1961794 RepID=UPI000BA9B175|nr:metal ABC transporter permease [Rubrivirga sp. SAORIC476]PAP80781.1 zinc ABC transporter permease [Rubrivirga sp. SAORIC476]